MKRWEVEKRFEYKGYSCVVVFQIMGYRCGYVGVPKSHKYYKMSGWHDEPICDIKCHWGLNYFESNLVGQDDENIWWIGFDCRHTFDGKDYDACYKYFKDEEQVRYLDWMKNIDGEMYNDYQVRDIDYVIEECKQIVDQLEEIENDN